MHSENEDKSLVTLGERETRFKAMLQYLILREAFEFDDKFPSTYVSKTEVADDLKAQKEEKKVAHANESAEKILREMELKFFDLFVEDDLVENYLLLDAPGKQDVYKKKDNFKVSIQEHISGKITVINSADKDNSNYKEILKKIVQSPKIENSIMTQDFIDDSKNINLIENIGKFFELSNSNPDVQKSITDTNLYLKEKENDFCQISENSIAIQAQLNTATALGWGFLNLTGKIITKALGDLSVVLSTNHTNSAPPSESVHGERITKILTQMDINSDVPPSKSVRGDRITKISAPPLQTQCIV